MRSSSPRLRLHVIDVSYFSGKLEAYLRHQRIPFERCLADRAALVGRLAAHTGKAQVPAIELPDGTWLRDSTAILRWFEARSPRCPAAPTDPALRFLMELLEDYADEWLWRPAMWWRWMPPESAHAVGRRIAREVGRSLPVPTWLQARAFAARQRREWLWGDGMTHTNSDAIAALYPTNLRALETILEGRPFLLGRRPSLVDYGFFGPFFRHFHDDPVSGRLLRAEAPRVLAWLHRLWNPDVPDAEAGSPFDWPQGPGWSTILREVTERYLPWMKANAEAWDSGASRFDVALPGLELTGCRVHPQRVLCLTELRETFASLDRAERRKALAPFPDPATVESVLSAPPLRRTPERLVLPLPARPAPRSWTLRLRHSILGTPR